MIVIAALAVVQFFMITAGLLVWLSNGKPETGIYRKDSE